MNTEYGKDGEWGKEEERNGQRMVRRIKEGKTKYKQLGNAWKEEKTKRETQTFCNTTVNSFTCSFSS